MVHRRIGRASCILHPSRHRTACPHIPLSRGHRHDTEYCKPHGITNIQEYIDATAGQTADELWQSDLADCPYILGGAFLLGMYVELGHEVVSSSLRDIYLMSESRSEPLTEDEIYRVFLANTPSDKQARFHELYQQYHGGPIPIS